MASRMPPRDKFRSAIVGISALCACQLTDAIAQTCNPDGLGGYRCSNGLNASPDGIGGYRFNNGNHMSPDGLGG